jgi:hypothetical protein
VAQNSRLWAQCSRHNAVEDELTDAQGELRVAEARQNALQGTLVALVRVFGRC